MVFRRLRGIFGGRGSDAAGTDAPGGLLSPEEREEIGTAKDPLHGYEAALERNLEAQKAEGRGDVEGAIRLYETSVAEGFVGAHPYERLAALYEGKGRHAEALRVTEAYVTLARSGRMPRGAQRSAERKLPSSRRASSVTANCSAVSPSGYFP